MDRPLRQIRIKLLTLASLILLSFYFGTTQQAASACWKCVTLTGGLCIGCDPNVDRGVTECTAIQETCSCVTSGSCGNILE